MTISGKVSTNSLALGGTDISATGAQINKLANVTADATELNVLDGVTGVTAANINQLANLGTNVAAFMADTYSKSDVFTKTQTDDRYVRQDAESGGITEVGALTAGSITDTFGAIDIGNDSIKAGSLEIGNVNIGTDSIGHGADADLITLGNESVTISGDTTTTTLATGSLTLGGTAITASAAQINKLSTVTSTDAELNILTGVTATKDDINVLSGAASGTAVASKAVIYDANKGVTADTLTSSGSLSVTTSADIGDITISNGSITSSGASGIDFSDNNLTTTGNITGNNFIINGNLTVTGSQTIVSKDTISVADPMMVLGAGATSGASDAGLLIDRGSDTNVAFIWDESQDQFAVVNTTATDNSTDNITISSYSDLRVNNLVIGSETLTSAVLSNLNSMVGATPGTLTADKAIVVDSNSHISAIKTAELHLGASGNTTQVTASGAEINLLDGSGSGTIVNGKAVVYGTSGEVNTSKLQISGTDVTASAAELNKLTGVTVGTSDINKLANIDADIQTQVNAKLASATAATTYAGINGANTITTVGALTSGSIADGFGNIDVGSNAISAANATIRFCCSRSF